jgi:uncharacterized Zn-binding protein involved in type VI secretion
MGQPAAKQGDKVQALDIHIVLVPSPTGAVPTPGPYSFNGIINGSLSSNVNIEGQPAATVNSTAQNIPPHIPMGGPFQNPPSNQATILLGSTTVRINNKGAARAGDTARTCNDPMDLPIGTVVAVSKVFIGG